MKRQILFSGKNKKNITNLLSAELAQREAKVKRKSEESDRLTCNFYFVNLHVTSSESVA